jgi:hypothetical protein
MINGKTNSPKQKKSIKTIHTNTPKSNVKK